MTSSPDAHAVGLLSEPVVADRYDSGLEDARECFGIVHRLMPSNVQVLDIGCGTGRGTTVINRGKRNTVFGIEPDEFRCEAARARGLPVHHGFANRAALEALRDEHGVFDVITLMDVLEHVPSPAELIADASEVLKADGCLIVSVPNVAHWSVRLKLFFGKFEYSDVGIMDATHLRWFTRASIVRLLSSQGFEILSVSASAGLWMKEYEMIPLPRRLKAWLVDVGRASLPGLFGCQTVVLARRA